MLVWQEKEELLGPYQAVQVCRRPTVVYVDAIIGTIA
jgi:hypothetical protein